MSEVARILSERNGAVPRYTSYPTAPHFQAGKGVELVSRLYDTAAASQSVSLYLHIPFCDRLCWFCGCNTKHTLKYEPVSRYVSALVKEIRQVGNRIGRRVHAGQIHLGGGSPSMLSAFDLGRIGDALREAFLVDDLSEISVEIDPSDVTDETIEGLKALGVTRISVGVQDFDPAVQEAINRPQTFEQTRDVIEKVRAAGVTSVNIDALYGLPLQTMDRLEDTIAKVISLQPDRIALFGYAHVPWVKKHQQMIRDEDLPGLEERFSQANRAADMLSGRGYDRIGIDHFAKPDDAMAIAAKSGDLRRNFQGYTTDTCDVLIPLGASSIGRYAGGYVQNEVATARYEAAVEAGELAASRGYMMTRDDVIRGYLIERLMCDFEVDLNSFVARFGVESAAYLDEMRRVHGADQDDLTVLTASRFALTDKGRQFARIVASRFDAHLEGSAFRYSKAV